MKLNLKLTSLLLGTCILAGPSASAMDPHDQDELEQFTLTVSAANANLERARDDLVAAQADFDSAQAALEVAQADFDAAQAALEAADVTRAAKAAKRKLQAAKDRCRRAASEVRQAERAVSEKESIVHTVRGGTVFVKNFNESLCPLELYKLLKSVYNNDSNVIVIVGKSRNINFWSPNPADLPSYINPLAMSITPDIEVSSSEVINRGTAYDTYRIQLHPLRLSREPSKYVDVVVYKDWNLAEDRPRDDAAFNTFLNDLARNYYRKLTVFHCGSRNRLSVTLDASRILRASCEPLTR